MAKAKGRKPRKVLEKRIGVEKTGVKTLKRNKMSGLRTIQGSSGSYSDENVTGNLIRTDGVVGNVSRRVTYASTDSVPYFVSTLSRYNALEKQKAPIARDMVSSYSGNLKGSVMKELAESLVTSETAAIEKSLGMVWPDLNGADELINKLNSLEMEVNKQLKSVDQVITETSAAAQQALYHFLSSKGGVRRFADKYLHLSFDDPQAFANLANTTSGWAKGIDWGDLERQDKIINDLFTGAQTFIDIFNAAPDSVGLPDAQTMRKALSSFEVPLGRGVLQGAIKQEDYVKLAKELNKVRKKVDSKFKKEVVGIDFGRATSGNLAEFLAGASMGAAMKFEIERAVNQEKELGRHQKEALDQLGEMAMEITSGSNEAAFKTIDLVYTFNGQSIPVDSKVIGASKIKDYGGLVYHSSVQVDFQEAYSSLMNNGSLPEPIKKLYRAMIFNVGVNQGYEITSLKERAIYAQEYLTSEKNFKHKFQSEESQTGLNTQFPYLVVLNGKHVRFSEVVRSMQDSDSFFANIEDKKSSLHATRSQNLPIAAQELYMKKRIAGRRYTDSKGKSRVGQATTKKGFVEDVPGLSEMTKNIESSFFGTEKKKKVHFNIVLRN